MIGPVMLRPLQICDLCDNPTHDWYVNRDYGHPNRGDIECRSCHEQRVSQETRQLVHIVGSGDPWVRAAQLGDSVMNAGE